jgi:biopolymer transport protein TolQ
LLAQLSLYELLLEAKPLPQAIMAILALISIISWTIIFSKWKLFRAAKIHNRKFLWAFRKNEGNLAPIAAVVDQFPVTPLVSVFEFGYEELDRQIKKRGGLTSKESLERAMQMGISEELTKLEHNMNWLATAAAVSPFIGLLGTVWGIIDAFSALSASGSASLRVVGGPIAEALFATALGLFAAIPAAVFYNYFSHLIREITSRMDDFLLEFLNAAERSNGE